MKSQYDETKLTKEQKQCLNLVESLGVFELRALARVFGGNSPTTQKRQDHIKIIMDKIIAKEEINSFSHKIGRPYKEIESISGVLDELSHITGVDYTQKSVKQKKITFNQVENEVLSQQLFPIQAKGIVLSNEGNELYFVNQYNNKIILIDKKFASKINKNDFVEGVAVVMNSKNDYLLTEISDVNFSKRKKSASFKEFSFKKKNNPLGQRYRFENTSKFVDNEKEIKTLVDNFKKNGVITIAVVPNIAEEETLSLQLIGFDCLVGFNVSQNAGQIYDAILNTLDFSKKMQKDGKSVALFLQDPVTLANYVDYFQRTGIRCFMGHTESVANIVREISKLIKIDGEKSFTCFSTFDSVDTNDQLFVSIIYKGFKQI